MFLLMYWIVPRGTRTRKGAVEALKRAFKPDENEGFKISNCTEKGLKPLKTCLVDYQNVYFLTEIMTGKQINSLMVVGAYLDKFIQKSERHTQMCRNAVEYSWEHTIEEYRKLIANYE